MAVNSLILLGLMVVGTSLVSYLALLGRMTSRFVLLMIPAVTMVIGSLLALEATGDPLTPFFAAGVLLLSVTMLTVTAVLWFFPLVIRERRSQRRSPENEAGSGVES